MRSKHDIPTAIQCVLALLLSVCAVGAWGQNAYFLWPTVLFVKGQDLCQFEEGFGASRKEQVNEMASQLKDLMR